MAAQTQYKFGSQLGAAGGIVDLAPYAIDTFLNEEETGKMVFGVGVVHGTTEGTHIKLPTASAAVTDFEGVTTNNRTTEYDLAGKVYIRENASIGVMKYGRIYARVKTGVEPAYGDSVYLVTSGDEAGYFSNASADGIAVKARFLKGVDTIANVQIAPIELFNQSQA